MSILKTTSMVSLATILTTRAIAAPLLFSQQVHELSDYMSQPSNGYHRTVNGAADNIVIADFDKLVFAKFYDVNKNGRPDNTDILTFSYLGINDMFSVNPKTGVALDIHTGALPAYYEVGDKAKPIATFLREIVENAHEANVVTER